MLFDSAERWATRTFKNDVRPSVIVTHKEDLRKEEAEAYKTRFRDEYAGEDNAYKALLLDQDVTVQVVSTTLKDLEFAGLLAWSERQIFRAFGTPPAVMCKFEGSESIRANTDEQLKWYWSVTVMADLILEARVVTEYMLPLWGDRFEAEHDLSHVEVLKEDQNAQHARLKEQMEHMVITPNHWRQEIGLDPIDAPGMDSLYIGSNLYEVSSTKKDRARQIEAEREAEANAPAPSELAPTGEEEEGD